MLFGKTVASSAMLALANASALSQRSLSGEATYYGGNVAGGACSFSTYTIPSSLFGTALSDSNWDTAAQCGACVSVTGPSGNSITAMIVDECPGCGANHLDLFPTAFSALADPTTGVIPVTWDYVACGITSALQVINKSGVSAYWFSMQVVNSNVRVASLDVSTDGGITWKSTTRTDYNFFENASGFGTTTVDVKITSVDGDVITIQNVEVSSGASATASGNFGSSSSSTTAAAAVEASSSTTAAAAAATNAVNAAVLVETSNSVAAGTSSIISSTKYRTTSIIRTTTRSSTTTSTSTITYYPPTSTAAPSNTTVVVQHTNYVQAAASSTNTYPISVMTISTCIPTVLYSVITVVPTSSPSSTQSTSTVSYAANVTMPVSTPTTSVVFTGSAVSLSGTSSVALAAFAGLAALLVM